MRTLNHNQFRDMSDQDEPETIGLVTMDAPLNTMRAAVRMQVVDELRQVEDMLSEDWDSNLNKSALMLAGVSLKLAHEAISQSI